jgi:transketolase
MRTCEGCQYFAKQKHVPSQELQTIPITWPFAIWGLDLVEKLPPAPRGFDHLSVMIDKSTKWIDAKPVATASFEAAVEFIKEVINQNGVMNMIITDNSTQFMGSTFVNFYDEQQINVRWAAVAHPKTNG